MAVTGASWKHPYGYDTDSDDYLNYPVIHVSYNDAVEYCTWAGTVLSVSSLCIILFHLYIYAV